MDGANRGRWLWAARRWVISVFLVGHIVASGIWTLPLCPLRTACADTLSYYILPLGLWHYWGMFAPDPMRDTVTLEAEVVDARGLRYGFAFPKLADYSTLAGVPRFRHSKFAANLAIPELDRNRVLAARHAVRQLAIPAEAFPVDVRLVYQVKTTPAPGSPPPDPLLTPVPYLLATIHIAERNEVAR